MSLRQVPGLKICTPATPRDAKGLVEDRGARQQSGARSGSPNCSTARKEWSSRRRRNCSFRLGEAEVKREGSDVTIICYAQTVPLALAAAEQLEEEDISAEVLDLRSIKPLD